MDTWAVKYCLPTQNAIRNLVAARLAADVLGVPTVLIARTDADAADIADERFRGKLPCCAQNQLQLSPGWHRRRAAVTRYHNRAAGISHTTAFLKSLVAQPAAKKTAHEGVTGTQHVEHVNLEPRYHQARFNIIGDVAGEGDAAPRAPFANQGRPRLSSDILYGGDQPLRSSQNAKLFLRADDQVATGERGLQTFSYGCAEYEAILAQIFRRQSPQDRPVVDVEDHSAAICFDSLRGAQARGEHAGRGEMRAVDQDRARGREICCIEIPLAKRHIGAIFAVKNQRKRLSIADAEHDQSGQARRVGVHAAHIHALAHQFFANEPPHMIGADPGQKSRLQTESCRRNRSIGGAAAHVFGE